MVLVALSEHRLEYLPRSRGKMVNHGTKKGRAKKYQRVPSFAIKNKSSLMFKNNRERGSEGTDGKELRAGPPLWPNERVHRKKERYSPLKERAPPRLM